MKSDYLKGMHVSHMWRGLVAAAWYDPGSVECRRIRKCEWYSLRPRRYFSYREAEEDRPKQS